MMRILKQQHTLILFILTLLCLFAYTTTTNAAPNEEINYQGKLTDTNGLAVPDGTYNMRFWLLQSEGQATTSAVFTEELTTTNRVQVTNGLFSVMIGSTTALSGVNFNQTLYLGVEIGSTTTVPEWDGEMSPRKVIGTVPAAFHAQNATTFDGLATTSFLRTDQPGDISSSSVVALFSMTQSGVGDLMTLFDGGTQVFTIDGTGQVGIGTTTPQVELAVDGDMHLTGGFYDNNNTRGISGQILQTDGSGVSWVATNTLGFGTSNVDTFDDLSDVLTTGAASGSLALYDAGSGLWEDRATSTLNIALSDTNGTLAVGRGGTGLTTFGGTNTILYTTSADTLASNASFVFDGTNMAVGTATPSSRLTVWGADSSGSPLFNLVNAASTTLFSLLTDGNITFGTSSATTTIYGGFTLANGAIEYNPVTNITSIERLNLGAVEFETDAGVVSWIDMQSSSTPQGTKLSYSAQLDSNPLLTVYGESDGASGVENLRVGVGTTTPIARFAISGDSTNLDPLFRIASSSNESYFTVTADGKIGIGTTSPVRTLSVGGSFRLTGAFYDGRNASGTLGQILSSTATGTEWISTSSLGLGNGTLDGLIDVEVTGAASGTILVYDATTGKWEDRATSTLGISGGASTLTALTDTDVSGAASGTLLMYDGTNWVDRSTSTLSIALGDTTGTLAVGRGGTGLTTFGGTNTILYTTSADTLASNASFVFDGTNLGIGSSTPTAKLTVQGTAGQTANLFAVASSTGIQLLTVTADGRVGLGTTTPVAKLSVAGGGASFENVILGSSFGSILSSNVGFAGYTNFSGGLGTGGVDSITPNVRLTSDGNLVNIGSIQAGQVNLTSAGTFAARVDYNTIGAHPRSGGVADVNGDGLLDIMVTNMGSDDSVSVFINSTSSPGTFPTKVEYGVGDQPVWIATGDLNGDGKADLVTANLSASSTSVLINNGDGTFATKVDYTTGVSPSAVAVGDLNSDGVLDLAVSNYASNTVSVFLNNGDGTFATHAYYTAGTNPSSVSISDLDGDGRADLAVSNETSGDVSVLINNGDGTFATKVDYPAGTTAFAIATADINEDGKADLAVANYTDADVSVLINNGDGTFATKVDYPAGTDSFAVTFGDVSGDGIPDMAVANQGGAGSVSVFINNGDGTFATKVDYTTGTQASSVKFGDLDGDGKADMFTVNQGIDSISIFINQTNTLFYADAVTGNTGIGTSTTASAQLSIQTSGTTDILNLFETGGTEVFTVLESGSIGIGSTTPTANLTVQGTSGQTNNLFTLASSTGKSLFSIGSLGQLISSSTATSTFANGIDIESGCFAINGVCVGGGASTLSALTDTDVSGAASGTILVYDGASWIDRATSTLGFKNNAGPTLIVAASDSKDPTRADFQADGTNDQDTIETALAALPAGGGTVMLLEGTYSINNEINITQASTSLVGVGPATLLKITATSTSWDVIDVTSTNHIIIKDLAIDGSAATGGSQDGISFGTVTYSTISNVAVNDMRSEGIYLSGGSHNIITENTLFSNAGVGSHNFGSDNTIISNNVVSSNSSHGLKVSYVSYVTITNNEVSSNQYGMHLPYMTRSIVSGNTINNNSRDGLWFQDGADDVLVSNNIFYNNGGTGSYSSIYMTASDRMFIVGNRIIDTSGTGYAINIANSTADNTIISNNYYTGVGAATINDAGTGTQYTQFDRTELVTSDEVGYNLLRMYGSSTLALASTTQLGTGNIAEWGNSTGEVMTLSNAGRLGIGTTTPTAKLTVQGTSGQTNNLFTLASSTGKSLFSISSLGQLISSSTATSTFANGIDIESGCFAVNGTCISGGASTLSALTDTDVTGAASGTVLVYDGSSWIDRATSTLGFKNNAGPTLIVAASDSKDPTRADFQADGTNDQDTIEAALAALPAGGGTVMLLEGTYSINNEINITQASTTLQGSGPSTVLIMTASSTSWEIIHASSTHHIYIGDLTINGSATTTGSHTGVHFFAVSSSTIENLTIESMTIDGIHLTDSSYNVQILNNTIGNSADDGISVRASSINNTISHNNVFGSADDGIGLSSSVTGNKVLSNIVNGNTNSISLGGGAANNIVDGNTVTNATNRGIYLAGADNNLIVNNVISNGFSYGIDLSNTAVGNNISDNYLHNNGGGVSASIFVNSGDYNLISGNYIIATGTAALIELDDTSNQYNIISNNIYSNPDLDDSTFVTDNGVETKYDDYNRTTLTTATSVGYNLLRMYGSSTLALASTTQLGTGNIAEWGNASGEVLTLSNSGYLGLGSTTPSAALSVSGSSLLDGARLTLGSTSASSLVINYAAPATSTITDGQVFAWTIATSTSADPILRIDTSGSGKPTTTIRGGLIVDGGAIEYNPVTGLTSIDNLELGSLNFENNAGVVSWVDLPVSTTTAGLTQSYTAQLDGNSLLTLYGVTDGSGGVTDLGVGIGSSTPTAKLTVQGTSGQSNNLFTLASSTGASLFSVSATGTLTFGGDKITDFVGAGLTLESGILTANIGSSTLNASNWTNGYVLQASTTATGGFDWVATTTLGFVDTDTDTDTNSYGPTVIVAASNASNTARAHFVADGTNDEEEIQAAIDSLPAGGGTVLLTEGTFNVGTTTYTTSVITMATSTRIMGQGSSTILHLNAESGNDIAIIHASGTSAVTIKDLHLEGNRTNQDTAGSDNQNGITFTSVSSSTIDNVIANDFQDFGIHFVTSYGNRVQNSTINDNEDYGFYLQASSSNNTLVGNIANRNSRGIYLNPGSSNNTLIGNTANNNSAYGFFLNSSSNNNRLSENTANNNIGTGFYLQLSSNNNTLIGNTANNNTGHGFYLNSSNNNTLTGNIIIGSNTFGIYFNSATRNTISSNNLEGNGDAGAYASIHLDGTNTDDNIIIGNTISATGTDPLIEIDDNTQERNTIANNVYINSELDDTTYVLNVGTNTRFDDYNRTTLTTNTEVGYNLLSISGSSSIALSSTTQLGTGNIAEWGNANGRAMTLSNGGSLSIGTTTSNGLLSVANSSGFEQFRVSNVANSVNYWDVSGNITTGGIRIKTAGADANVSGFFNAKGSGSWYFNHRSSDVIRSLELEAEATAVNYLKITGRNTGASPSITAVGTDTDINISLVPKGSGNVGIGTTTPVAKLSVTGTAGQTSSLFRIASSSNNTLFDILADGSVDIGSGAFNYDVATNKVSIERLDLGAVKFEDSAGWVSWIDVSASTSASAGTPLAYTAQIDSQDILTLYSEEDGNGGIGKVRVVVGTSSAAVYSSTNIPGGSMIISDGAFCVDNGGDNCDDASRTRGIVHSVGADVTSVDVAENYPTKDVDLAPGDLVMLDPEYPVFVTKYDASVATTSAGSALVGVISTQPGVLLGGFGNEDFAGETKVPVTLTGRVPVKVNFQGGNILPGDRISFSSVPGVGMKATTTGTVAGIALEPFIATSSSASTTQGTVLVFIDNDHYIVPQQFVIDADGNVAFGTSTDPAYKVKVGGDIAATGFINVSASSTKRDITELSDDDQKGLMNALRAIELKTYQYKTEATSSPKRLGLIAEEAPSEVLSVDGKGVDLYKLSSLTLAGVQDVDARVLGIEATLEELTASSTEDGTGATLWDRLVTLAQSFVDGVLTLAGIHTNELCVGSVCVDETTFLRMVENATDGAAAANQGASQNDNNSGGADADDQEPQTPPADTGSSTDETGSSSAPVVTPDTEAPQIAVHGANTMELTIGDSYTETGATALDNVDGDVSSSMVISGSVDTSVSGTYKVTYSATDAAGNTGTGVRTVVVIEPEPEVEELPAVEPIPQDSDGTETI